MEISASESRQHIIEKTFKWLHETDYSVHAVITCNFTNMPSPGSNKPFKAEIAVWVRSGSGDLTLDYPCDECYGGHKHTTPRARSPALVAHKGSGTLRQENDGDAGGSNSDTLDLVESNMDASGNRSQTPYIPHFDPLAHEHSRLDPGDPHREQRICCRSGNWIVAYDESTSTGQEEPEPELLPDVYDILRPFPKLPEDRITNRTISVPLGTLRENLVLEVQRMRGPSPRPQASPRPAKKQRPA